MDASALEIARLHAHLKDTFSVSAPWMWELAPTLCTGAACQDYHKVWQVLRLLGVNPSLESDSAFLLSALRTAAPPSARVLIYGAADHSLLAYVFWALRSGDLSIRVMDRCASALRANAWYAERMGIPVALVAGDWLAEPPPELPAVDVIVAHNVLSFCDVRGRERLLRCWQKHLVPGGHLLLVQRIRPPAPAGVSRCRRAATLARIQSLLQTQLPALATPTGLAALNRFLQRPKPSLPDVPDAILAPIAAQGWQVRWLQHRHADSPLWDGESDPQDAARESRFRLCLLVRRPWADGPRSGDERP